GDHLKAASDLGVPVIGVGLLYRAGYFAQTLSAEGWQQERYPSIDPHGLPLVLLDDGTGTPLRVGIELPGGGTLRAQVWKAQVGAGLGFDEALQAVRAGIIFTTHTPVPAGIDRFHRDLVRSYFDGPNATPGLPPERILELGAESDPGVFNMAHMGLRLAQRA